MVQDSPYEHYAATLRDRMERLIRLSKEYYDDVDGRGRLLFDRAIWATAREYNELMDQLIGERLGAQLGPQDL